MTLVPKVAIWFLVQWQKITMLQCIHKPQGKFHFFLSHHGGINQSSSKEAEAIYVTK